MFREDERRATPVGSKGHIDRQIGQFFARIILRDGRIIPLRDFAEEDANIRIAGKLEILYFRQIVSDHDAARGGGDHDHPLLDLRNLLVAHGGITRGEINRALGKLLYSRARTHRLVVYLDVGMKLVVLDSPALIERSWK